jgi:hypothetical protein
MANPLESERAHQRTTAARLNDLRAQALHARQRYDLYKAKAYSQRLTSPVRMRELERASARAREALRFAEDETRRAAAAVPGRRSSATTSEVTQEGPDAWEEADSRRPQPWRGR